MDYVHIKSAAGEVKSTVGAYLNGVLKNGFNVGGELDQLKQQKEESVQIDKNRTSAFHKHRRDRMLELFSQLSDDEVIKHQQAFADVSTGSVKVAIHSGGFERKDEFLINEFNQYLLKVLLTEPRDTDIDVYAREKN